MGVAISTSPGVSPTPSTVQAAPPPARFKGRALHADAMTCGAAADALKPIAAEVGCSLAQLSIAWVLKNKHVSTCILGATSVAQLRENLGALAFVDALTPALLARIEAAVAGAGGAAAAPALHKVERQVRGVRNVAALSNCTL